jgi:hypothetical protein
LIAAAKGRFSLLFLIGPGSFDSGLLLFFRHFPACDDFATHFPLFSGRCGTYGKSVHFLPQNRRSDCCKKARRWARTRCVKDRMNGTARDIVSLSNSANGENCSPRPDFRVPAVFVEWRAALEGICPSGTLKDTE